MNRPEDLKQTADEMLGGLVPSAGSYARIMSHGAVKPRFRFSLQRGMALAAALVAVAAGGYAALRPDKQPMALESRAAGALYADGSEIKVGDAPMAVAAVPRGAITLSKEGSPSYLGLWAAGKGANFPMVAANGRYYRMLTNPTSIDGDMLGAPIGDVSVFTDEPALADANSQVVSNVAQQGATVYHVRGMENAAAAALVDGEMRVFQRVGFGGSAVLGGEGLADTLGSGTVTALQLSGVGTVTDSAKIDALMSLLSGATYRSASSKSTKQALLIEYDNRIVLQLCVKDNSLIGCGTFSCPDFVSAFAASVE